MLTFLSLSLSAGNYIPIRLAAFDCLLLSATPGSNPLIAAYLFQIIAHDQSRVVRRHVASGISEALILALFFGAVRGAQPVQDRTLVEADGETAVNKPKAAKVDEVEMSLKALKKEIGKMKEMKEGIISVIA